MDKDKNNKSYLLLSILVGTFVIILWIDTMLLVPRYYQTPDSAGTFGDMFGSINALFSGLAFVGIIATILIQSKELSLQREELKATREELKGQKEQLEKQNETLSKQAFENTFFQLLKTFNEIITYMEIATYDRERPIIKGSEYFIKIGQELNGSMNNKIVSKLYSNTPQIEIQLINQIYSAFYNNNEEYLGHYFRMLYNIIKFVDNSNETNKKFYVDIVRAQLSSPELSLIYYNCISDKGKEKLAPLVVKYNLLKHMPKNEITEKIKLS